MSLATTHKGWENEHLATFLLSRVAFVASPLKVGDDVGTDLFCTLYGRESRNGTTVLVPRSSIAVQVKSNRNPLDIATKLSYLRRLEVPYYLGVVDQQALSLELYSARFLPCLLSYRGSHERLDLVPVAEFEREYRPTTPEGHFRLLCPRIATLQAGDSPESTAGAADSIKQDAAAALKAIASRLNMEYIFDIPGGQVEIFTGRDSARTFRESFLKRLAEALLNLAWLITAGHPVAEGEADTFLAMPDALALYMPVPNYVRVAQEKLLRAREAAA